MPDQFKKFLQKHRANLDQENVPRDLFDKIMQQSFDEAYKKDNITPVRKLSYYLTRIAAIGLIIMGSYFAFQNFQPTEIPQIVNHKVESTTNQTSTSSEIITKPSSTSILSENSSTQNNLTAVSKKNNRQIIDQFTSTQEAFLTSSDPSVEINSFKTEHIGLEKIIHPSPVQESNTLKEIHAAPDVVSSSQLEARTNDSISVSTDVIADNLNKPNHESQDKSVVNNNNQNSNRGIISLDEKVKKGIFSFFSKKSRKWSQNTLAIDPKNSDNNTLVNINIKTDLFAFSKTVKINSLY